MLAQEFQLLAEHRQRKPVTLACRGAGADIVVHEHRHAGDRESPGVQFVRCHAVSFLPERLRSSPTKKRQMHGNQKVADQA